MATITSANATIMLGATGLLNVPVELQGWEGDDSFASQKIKTGEIKMGGDGKIAAGYLPHLFPFEITLQPNSASNQVFDAILAYQNTTKDLVELNVTVLIPSIGAVFAFSKGYTEDVDPMPAGKKVLQARKFEMQFESMSWAPA